MMLTLILLFQQESFVQLWLSHFVSNLHFERIADRHLPASLLSQQAAIDSTRALTKSIGSDSHKMVADVNEDKLQGTRLLEDTKLPLEIMIITSHVLIMHFGPLLVGVVSLCDLLGTKVVLSSCNTPFFR